MNRYELVDEKRHETKAQDVRHEREAENKRLDKLKIALQAKLAVDKSKIAEVRAA